ncbi:MAG: LuxR C-terminal-related transcriptional regulator [Halofilum sp. (in: g-proteobacteria)]|nr:LuxR C-terminal-related transcriptional regulator [Halofilum sp. (in: g-proteobacteria)]
MSATVVIADDHELVRTGVRRLLEDLRLPGRGGGRDRRGRGRRRARASSRTSRSSTSTCRRIGGFEVTQKIRRVHPECRVIILTAHTEGPLPRTLLETGVAGFLTKGCAFSEMDEAITKVRAGERYISHEVAQQLALASLDGDAAENPFDRLTSRELQVALMLLAGEVNRDISRALQLSPKTVTTYRQRILKKVGVRNLTDLLRLAIQYDLTSPDHAPAVE